ncbi:MAG: DPP IV N-terminal domain-containing protein [Bacteroidales bacterium]
MNVNRKSIAASLICVFATTLLSSAQPGLIKSHPANKNGRMMTMEEAVLGLNTRVKSDRIRWDADNHIVQDGADTVRCYDPATWTTVPESTEKNEGKNVAYTSGKSLYYNDSLGNSHVIAESENDQITYGQIVSRNEFGIEEGFFWSNSGKKIAFYRKDESQVTDFPLLDINTRTGSLMSIKYPMNGMSSENVRLGIYDLASNATVYAAADDFGYDQYLTNISWSPDDKFVFIQVLDRSQKHLRLNMYKASTGEFVRTVLTEDNEKFVEPLDKIHFLKDTDRFIYRTDNRDGYKNLYLCDAKGAVRRLTQVDADVSYIANDGKSVYYTSAEISPVENHLFRIDISLGRTPESDKFSTPLRLTKEEGWHNVEMSEDCKWFIDNYSSLNVPRMIDVKSTDGKKSKNLFTGEDPLEEFATGGVALGTVKSADGKYDNYYRLIKPADFDPAKKYPVILYVYGGPHSQMVTDSWLAQIRMWEMLMAEKGYIVYVQDNRGTQNRGADFEKAIHDFCGKAETADQMEGIKMLSSLPYADTSRIGVHGWSYGGFMTISLMTEYPKVFKVGVAGGPVIDWKWYEVMYGERYMDTPESNPEGFAATSLINKAKDLKGKLLICQGAVDNTVVWQHSLSFVRECVKNNVQLDYFPYPCAQHNVFGRDRIHLMDKVTNYFEDNLK